MLLRVRLMELCAVRVASQCVGAQITWLPPCFSSRVESDSRDLIAACCSCCKLVVCGCCSCVLTHSHQGESLEEEQIEEKGAYMKEKIKILYQNLMVLAFLPI